MINSDKIKLRISFGIVSFVGFIGIINLLTIPSDSKNAVLLGYSIERIFLFFIMFLSFATFTGIFLALLSGRDWSNTLEKWIHRHIRNTKTLAFVISGSVIGLLISSISIFISFTHGNSFSAIAVRLQPLAIWLFIICSLSLWFINGKDGHENARNMILKIILSSKLHLGILITWAVIGSVMWANVSQWREDQATNLWLGATQNIQNMPVGLMSSKGIINPNGMLLLGKAFAILPSVLHVSIVLSLIQIGLAFALCWSYFKQNKTLLYISLLGLITPIVIRASVVELWNQWIYVSINLFFLLWVNSYYLQPSAKKIPWLVALICFAPSLYLVGIVNGIVYAVLGFATILYKPPLDLKENRVKGVFFSLVVIGISLELTWIPYFQNVDISSIIRRVSRPPDINARMTMDSLLGFLKNIALQWTGVDSFPVFQINNRILSKNSLRMLDETRILHLIQAILALLSVLAAITINFIKNPLVRAKSFKINNGAARFVIYAVLLVLFSYALSPLLGGFNWAEGIRGDQTVQFFPQFVIIVLMTPFIFQSRKWLLRGFQLLTIAFIIVYSIHNLASAKSIVKSHIDYQGSVLSRADVPLVHKMQAVTFIADDWTDISNSNYVPVDYLLGGGRWDWVTNFGYHLENWYPAPYTIGRIFDYDFLSRYGFTNLQEGVQERSFGQNRYLITYAFEEAPYLSDGFISISHHYFGRLRVTVVEDEY